MKIIREKKHRLYDEVYIGEQPISFTLCIKNRVNFFTDYKIFKIFENFLLNEMKSYDCSAYAYVFMPNHVHLLLAGNNSNSNVKKCLNMFKQKSGYYLGKYHPEIKWQKDYYDHILRGEDNLDIQIKYILNNPVRAGLVDYWKKYLFKGSTIYSLNEWEG